MGMRGLGTESVLASEIPDGVRVTGGVPIGHSSAWRRIRQHYWTGHAKGGKA